MKSTFPEDSPYVRENGQEVTDFKSLTKAELLTALRQIKDTCRTLRRHNELLKRKVKS